MKIAIPTVHLNGSDGGVLQTQNEAALAAVEAAIEALIEAAPHGRDYYVQGDVDRPMAVATAQYNTRVETLTHVRNDLRAIVHGIREQCGLRGQRGAL